jgi:hypothetical protein
MDRILQSYQCTRKILPAKEINDKRDHEADQQTGGQRKVEGKALTMDRNIAGEVSEPRDFAAKLKNKPDDNQQQAQDNQRFSQFAHTYVLALARINHGPQNP